MSDRKPDQLDMALRRELLTIRRNFTDARIRVRRWEPAPYREVRGGA